MKKINTLRLVFAALMAALCCVLTLVLQIPSPMNGYVNLGDCAVLLSGWILGPAWGAAAAGIGSGLADIITGYAHYAPGTIIIKALMAVIAALLAKAVCRDKVTGKIVSGIAAELWMVLGYFIYACLLLGKGLAAAASIPGNLFQGAVGIVAAVAIIQVLRANKSCRELLAKI